MGTDWETNRHQLTAMQVGGESQTSTGVLVSTGRAAVACDRSCPQPDG